MVVLRKLFSKLLNFFFFFLIYLINPRKHHFDVIKDFALESQISLEELQNSTVVAIWGSILCDIHPITTESSLIQFS